MAKLYLILGAVGLLAFLGTGWYISDLKGDLKEVKGERDRAQLSADAYEKALTSERESVGRVTQIAEQNLRDLEYAKQTIEELRASVDAGNTELHVNAECPDTGSVPASSSSSNASNAASPRLTESARQAYFTLRERHAEATTQINGLQKYILSECK